MGTPKAALDWHGSTLLRRVTGLVGRAVDGPVVVVRAPGQELPALPPDVEVVADAREGHGPLQGLEAGLAALADRAQAAYASSTDVPLLHPRFVRAVLDALGDDGDIDVALPEVGGYRQPLSAAYRTDLLPLVRELIGADRMRPAFLFERVRVRTLTDEDLHPADPELRSVANLNEPADYAQALTLPAPAIAVERFGTLAPPGGPRRATVAGWTLGAVAAAVGLALDEHVVAALNGDQITRDPELPLVAGDAVAFLAADAGG